MKKILPLIPLILWIMLFPFLGGVIYWQTNYPNSLFISLISLVAIFNLVWYLAKLSYQNEHLDVITTVGNLLILNVPAYLLIKMYYRDRDQNSKVIKSGNQNLLYAAWELEDLKERNFKKYQKIAGQTEAKAEHNVELILKDQVRQGFGIFILMKIYEQFPDLVDTFQLINKFKNEIEDEVKFSENLLNFKEVDLELFFDQEALTKLNPDPKTQIYEVLVNSNSDEIYLVFKENRLEMQNKAKELIKELK